MVFEMQEQDTVDNIWVVESNIGYNPDKRLPINLVVFYHKEAS